MRTHDQTKKTPVWLTRLHDLANKIDMQVDDVLHNKDAFEGLGLGAGGDVTLRIDKEAEKVVIDFCKSLPCPSTLISEELGEKEFLPRISKSTNFSFNHVWVVADPIDGSNNIKRGIPFFNTSIAIATGPTLGDLYAGIVKNLRTKDEYVAEASQGAYWNGHVASTAETMSLDKVAMGVNLTSSDFRSNVIHQALYSKPAVIRQLGANAEEICFVGTGALDVFVNVYGHLRTVDMAAAKLFVEEAGGIVTDDKGNIHNTQINPAKRVKLVAAANIALLQAVQRLL
ncbi:MAG: inositol monophosphatase family protein [Candidatus Ranarchaeia archaeon]